MKTKEIVLKTGVAIVPEEFMVIEETRTDNADYAGVIAEKQGTIPHYVVFSEKPLVQSQQWKRRDSMISVVRFIQRLVKS